MASPVSVGPKIFGTNSTFHFDNRVAKSSGLELWKVKVGDFPVASSLVAAEGAMVLVQTSEEIACVHGANGSILWKKAIDGLSTPVLIQDKFVHLQSNGAEIVLRSVAHGNVLKTIQATANTNFTPRLTSNQLIVIQEQIDNKTALCAYSSDLAKVWEIILPLTHSSVQVFTLKDYLAIVASDGVTCYSLDGKSLWSLSFAQMGGLVPNVVAKLSDTELLLHSHKARGLSQIVNLSSREVKPFQLPELIIGFPMVLHKPNGEFELFYQAPAKDLDFGSMEYRLVMVDCHGTKKWEIPSLIQPHFMISDHNGHVFVAYSKNLHQFAMYGSYQTTSSCYVKGYNGDGKELFTSVPSPVQPVLSPLSIGVGGELYYLADGTLYSVA